MNLTSVSYELILNRLRESLSTLLVSEDRASITEKYTDVLNSFEEFFETLKGPYFIPEYLRKGDPALSEVYNSNLEKIYKDIEFLYNDLKNLKDSKIEAYNYAAVLVSEVSSKANAIASTVLDLNILSNFTRGDSIVAGDDFKNLNFIDSEVGLGSSAAELVYGSSGIGLARAGSSDITDLVKSIEVIPLAPVSLITGGDVNTSPTPDNLERFYEGNYYNLLGLARPEGGAFNIRYQMKKVPKEKGNLITEGNEEEVRGFFTDYGASKEDKKAIRLQMIDQSPSTFWECEYLYKIKGTTVGERIRERGDPEPPEPNTVIDLKLAEQIAKQFDFKGRDLIVDIVVTFKAPLNLNFVAINPVIFGATVFPYVEDISTADLENGQYTTVDGWNNLRFPKIITPEANEFLTDSQLGVSLAPNRYEYSGQGIYPFPVRFTDKLKIRMRVDSPVPQIYERISILLTRHIDLDLTITTTTKRGILG